MKNSQKGFFVPLLLAIIAVLVIGGGVYIYNNKKVEVPAVVDTGTQTLPVTNTKTYTNSQYGFEFNYPKTLTLQKGQGSFNSEFFFLGGSNELGIIGGIQLWVVPNQTTLDGFISKMMGNTQYTSSNENIASISAKRLFLKDPLVAEGNDIFLIKDGYGYRWIAFKLRDIDGGQNMIPVLNNILSTFKFTK